MNTPSILDGKPSVFPAVYIIYSCIAIVCPMLMHASICSAHQIACLQNLKMLQGATPSYRKQAKNGKQSACEPLLPTRLMFRGCLLSEVLIGKFGTSQERVPCRPRPARLRSLSREWILSCCLNPCSAFNLSRASKKIKMHSQTHCLHSH